MRTEAEKWGVSVRVETMNVFSDRATRNEPCPSMKVVSHTARSEACVIMTEVRLTKRGHTLRCMPCSEMELSIMHTSPGAAPVSFSAPPAPLTTMLLTVAAHTIICERNRMACDETKQNIAKLAFAARN